MPHLLLQPVERSATQPYEHVEQDEGNSLEDPIHQRFTRRGASRNIDIYRHNPITTSRDTVAVMIIASSIGARSHTDHPSRVGHLIIDLTEGGGHLVRESAGDDHDIGLARGSTEDYTQTILIVAGGGKVHHLDGATGESEGHGPEGTLTGPIGDLIQRRSGESRSALNVSSSKRRGACTKRIAWLLLSSLGSAKAPLVLVYRWL